MQEQARYGLHARSKTNHCLSQTTANSIRYQSLVPSVTLELPKWNSRECGTEPKQLFRQRTNPPWRTTLNKLIPATPCHAVASAKAEASPQAATI